jgi:SAM-dependent methyltransferase
VDASSNSAALLAYLDDTDRSLSPMKSYVATLAQSFAGEHVLDLGCGVGHDLARLAAAGARPIGIDLSAVALAKAHSRGHFVLRADGARLPFGDGVFAGCRIERVLQHVAEPDAVLDEAARVVRTGGFIAVFEPDWTTLRVESELVPDGSLPARFAAARHPTIGSDVARLLPSRGWIVKDVVTELSFGYSLDAIPLDAASVTRRGVDGGELDPVLRRAWLDEQQQRSEAGTFRASWAKILTVARRG